jgi:hypothetical protein
MESFAIYDVDKDEYFVAVTIWELFHYILVGINTELLCGFRTESIRILYKNTTVSPGHYMTKMVSLYNGTKRMD